MPPRSPEGILFYFLFKGTLSRDFRPPYILHFTTKKEETKEIAIFFNSHRGVTKIKSYNTPHCCIHICIGELF